MSQPVVTLDGVTPTATVAELRRQQQAQRTPPFAWRITVASLLALSIAVNLLLYWYMVGNRAVGTGNRDVICAVAKHIQSVRADPAVAKPCGWR